MKLMLIARSRFDLWEHSYTATLFEIIALPRATPFLARAISVLIGGEEKGEYPSLQGLEYSGLREYQPGDRLRRIDWLSTFRLQKLIIREYMAGGGSLALLVNIDAPGPSVLDFTISAALSAALSAAKEEMNLSLHVISGGEASSTEPLAPTRALEALVKISLEKLGFDFKAFEQILPEPSSQLARLADKLGALSLEKLFSERANKAHQLAKRIGDGLSMYCGSLVSNTHFLLDLAAARLRMVFVVHPKPWIDAKSFEEIKALKETHKRIQEYLSKHFLVYARPEAAGREIELYTLSRVKI